jgi:hypothetical protein
MGVGVHVLVVEGGNADVEEREILASVEVEYDFLETVGCYVRMGLR